MATNTKSALHTPLCDLLGIRYPLQAQRVGFPAAIRAREDGDVDNGHAACGQSAGLIGEITSARELIDRLVTEAEAARARLGALKENS